MHEQQLVAQAVTHLSASERTQGGRMSAHSVRRAVQSLRQNGYCIVAGLLEPQRQQCRAWGAAVLEDLHAAAALLKQGDPPVDLYHPGGTAAAAYRELSMREDCRMDLRHGPALERVRGGNNNNRPVTVTAADTERPGDFLRGHPGVLAIARQVMNPVDPALAPGNFGRYNFDGRGPDGSFQDLHAGVVGGIVSLPGAADQAIHADTPHLFEAAGTQPLPAHYINVFTPGCPADPRVGQTAFVHGSHRLDFVARYVVNHDDDNDDDASSSLEQFDPAIWQHLVRPVLNVGDVLLFDCRILHFGLANTHPSIERPLLYTNLTMHWFHDPKNWDQHRSIFASSTTTEEGDDDNDNE